MNSSLMIESIRNALIAADESGRRQVLLDLFVSEDPEMAALIARYLGDPSPAVSEAAVEALSRCENPVAAEAAALHLHSPEAPERGYAMEALTRLGRHALPSLIRLLEHPDHNVRKFATDAIASIRSPESITVLLRELESTDALVAAAAAEALGLQGNPDVVPALGAALERGPDWLRISALASLGMLGGENALDCISRISPNSPAYVQAAAVNAVSVAVEGGSSAAYAFLAAMLDTQKPILEEAIVKALGHWIANEGSSIIGMSDLTHAILPFKPAIDAGLNSQDPQVRAAAVTCLRAVEGLEIPRVLQMFTDQETIVRLAVLNTLVFHSGISPDELAHIAMEEQEDNSIRILALHSLSNITSYQVPFNEQIMNGLIDLADNSYEPAIRAAAMRVLLVNGAEEGKASALALLNEEDSDMEEFVLAELENCPADLLLPIAMEGLADSDPDVCWRIFAALVRPDRAFEITKRLDGQALVIAALDHADLRIRVHAVSILGKCADQAWARELLRSACESPDDQVRVRAIDACGTMAGSQEELDILKTHLSDSSERVRTAAFRAIVRLDCFDEASLKQALLDPYIPIQQAALVALLSSEQYLKSQSLRSLAEQITSQSADGDISELGNELRLRFTQC